VAQREFDRGLAGARALDAADEISSFRARFALPKDGSRAVTYLCGHSLGLMPRGALDSVAAELARWAARGVEGHFDDAPRTARRKAPSTGWLDYHERFSAPLAAITGAQREEVVAMNTLTVNLHLMLVSFFRPTAQRYKILIERDAFPSDRYAVQSQLRFHGLNPDEALLEIGRESDGEPDGESHRGGAGRGGAGSWTLDRARLDTVLAAEGERIALVLLPGVQYLSGERLDIAALTAAARRYGCAVGFDLAHAIGNVPLALHRDAPDFAVWCSYKYLNAGPGAVGGCFVHADAAARADLPRFAGWWGHDVKRRFLMEREFRPLRGAAGWQLSNPPILSLAPLAASLALFEEAGLARLRRKSEKLTSYLAHLIEAELGERARLLTPAAPKRRGCQIALQLDPAPRRAAKFAQRLRAAGVVADWREPNVLRLAPVPLYNRFRDVYDAVRALKRTLDA
jgi:kynureninase